MSKRNREKQCAVCFASKDNEIFVECSMCGLGVHGSCYGCSFTSNSRSSTVWKCRFCHAITTQKVNGYDNAITKAIKCRICNQCKFGALKSCGKRQGFAHLVCALWTPFIFLENSYNMAPIRGVEKCGLYKSALNKLICSICDKSHATMKCRLKECNKHYHPLCLMETHRHCMMERDAVIDNSFVCRVYYVYCPDHVGLHKDWDYNEGHKQSKSRRVVFDKKGAEDIRMIGNDVIDKFECESNVNVVHIDSTNAMDHTPSPLPWAGINSDRDSVFGFGDNLFLREYSPLMMGHEMTPTLFDQLLDHDEDMNMDHFNFNNTNNETQIEDHSMYLMPKLGTVSTNSTFGTISSPQTVGSFSQNGNV